MPLSRKLLFAPLLGIALVMTGCDSSPDSSAANSAGHIAPTATTEQANRDVLDQRPFDNRDDFENARRGLIAQDPELVIDHLEGGEVWNMPAYGFIDEDGESAPASVNPSLWRQAALNNIHGLFKVTDGLYQIRGYDLANMSIIEGETGWILV
ncbi:MAG: MBL fold metallo-hydrolase, partial [Marinobacter adhaerens]|nr:MBL fold metallo-hydrolase [Marinobacter adhaerens]